MNRYSVHKSFGSGAFVDRDGSDIIGSPAVCKRLNDQDLEFSTLRAAYRRDVDALQGEIDELEADNAKLHEANARRTIDKIARICPTCGDDMCGDEHKDCYKCKHAATLATLREVTDALENTLNTVVNHHGMGSYELTQLLSLIAKAREAQKGGEQQ